MCKDKTEENLESMLPGPLLIGVEVYVGCRTKLGFGTEKVSENTGQIEVGRVKLSARAGQDMLVASSSL